MFFVKTKRNFILLTILLAFFIVLHGSVGFFVSKIGSHILLKIENIQQPSTEQTIADEDNMVYITKYGEKYHREHCRYLRNSKEEITLTTAKNQNYTPCSICYP